MDAIRHGISHVPLVEDSIFAFSKNPTTTPFWESFIFGRRYPQTTLFKKLLHSRSYINDNEYIPLLGLQKYVVYSREKKKKKGV